ncbi:MAG: ferredoxin [Verrucomicrobiales bacterium]|jgi:ferredoxin|nr:ferredoxin [Verrucomicrobiales bacterium]
MADASRKLPENVPGKWYVDDTCTPCHVCLDEAPMLLKYNDDQSYVFFFKQPSNPEEEDAAVRALDICPTGAIGNDG